MHRRGATLARAEGQPPTGIPDVDAAYDYMGELNDFFKTVFGRDGANGMGGLNVGDGGIKVVTVQVLEAKNTWSYGVTQG